MELLFRVCLPATFVRARTGRWLRVPLAGSPVRSGRRGARTYALMAKLDA